MPVADACLIFTFLASFQLPGINLPPSRVL